MRAFLKAAMALNRDVALIRWKVETWADIWKSWYIPADMQETKSKDGAKRRRNVEERYNTE